MGYHTKKGRIRRFSPVFALSAFRSVSRTRSLEEAVYMIHQQNGRRTVILITAIAVVFLCIVAVLIWGVAADRGEAPEPQSRPAAEKQEEPRDGKKLLDVELEVLLKTLEDGVRDMGLLITQEYYFTDAVTQSKVKTLFSIPLGFTETTYVATYDGVVTAGIDFTDISIGLDVREKKVTVQMPKAEVQNVDIDPNSFVLYSEKNGLGNPLSISDYNGSIIDLENKARSQAVERGLLDQADENAKRIVRNFMGGFLDLTKYDILWDAR